MDDAVIVTIRSQNGREEDFELPRDKKCGKWLPILEQYMRSEYGMAEDMFLLHLNGSLIKDSDTLKSLDVWDGGILNAEWR